MGSSGGSHRLPGGLGAWELLLDGAAIVAVAVELVQIVTTGSGEAVPVLVLATAAVIARRRMPLAAAVAAIVASGLVFLVEPAVVPVWVLAEVVLFTLALRRPRSLVLAVGAVHAALLFVGAMVVFHVPPYDPLALVLPVWTVAVIASGLALRATHDHVRSLTEQARAAVAYRDSEVQRQVGAERLRIARDLHDSVAHTVSIISVHAGAAERFVERDPQRARDSLHQVRASARTVVDELQDILTVLRDPDGSDVTDAVPGIESLDGLLTAARATGTDIVLSSSVPPELDRAVSVAAYRIVQESLTNARKHGNGTIEITIAVEGDSLRIRVVNPFAPRAGGSGGFGLLGMRERAASAHGDIRTEAEGDRFVVDAVLPLQPHARAERRA
jgi:signal transduction histidine kinase